MKESVNSKFGEIFSELRDASGKTLSDFEEIGISHSSLSKFENGESLLRYDKLVAALQLLHIEEAEYSFMINDFHYDYFEVIMREIIDAYQLNDREKLQRWYDEGTEYGQRRIALASSAVLHGNLTSDEVDELRDKFFAVTTWTYFNLQVLSLTIDQFEEGLALSFMKDFWRKEFYYRNAARYRLLIIQMGHRLVESLIKKSKSGRSRVLLNHLDELIQEEDVVSKICQNFEKGFFEFQFSSTKNGLRLMSLALEQLNFWGCHKLYCYYKRLYEEYLGSTI